MRHITLGCVAFALAVAVAPITAFAVDYKCVYVAKKRGGLGDRVPGTRGVGEVSFRRDAPRRRKIKRRLKACNKALINCNAKLAARKLRGKNRNAKCVVVRIKKG